MKEELIGDFHAREELRADMLVWNQCQSHSRDVVCADGVPVVRAVHPPEFVDEFAAAEDVQTRLEDAAVNLLTETFT